VSTDTETGDRVAGFSGALLARGNRRLNEDGEMPPAPIDRRTALRLATLFMAGTAAGVARAQASPVTQIQRLCATLVKIMRMGRSSPFEQRFQTLAPVVDQVFDLQAVLEISVGPTWRDMPPAQQAALQAAFRRYTVASYVNSFNNYTGQRFDVSPETRTLGNGDQVVQSKIIPPSGDSHSLDYVMREGEGDWRVVDVLADGAISRVAVQRSDFRSLLMRGGAPALAASLQQKTADLGGGAGQ
jgi:phospholipid transport system substrate-binding protein